jgi:hypothetical protein
MSDLDSKKNTLDKEGNLRIDWLFSYWVYLWFLIFYFTIGVKDSTSAFYIQKYFNPTLALYFALFENILTFVYIILVNPETMIVLKFLLMMLVVKILPIYLIRDKKMHFANDIYVLIFIFGTYTVWLWINDTNIYEVYERTINAVSSGDNKTPFYNFMDYLYRYFQSIQIPLHL